MATISAKTTTTFWLAAIFTLLLCQLARWYFALESIINFGLAFNIMLPIPVIFTVVLVFLVAMVYLFYSQKKLGTFWALALGLVVGGGTSNMLDRIFLSGGVADYWRLGNLSYINLPDILITIGIASGIGMLIRTSWSQK